jgi:hypothetical protein
VTEETLRCDDKHYVRQKEENEKFIGLRVLRLCPLVLMAKKAWIKSRALISEDDKVVRW